MEKDNNKTTFHILCVYLNDLIIHLNPKSELSTEYRTTIADIWQ